ncbi:putative MAD; mothers against decapentaplegic interacting protein [Paratrimastix pyriformis]|uniref:MAD n=1 Tax=Paratrimastix pyriformis TaxID=342808 RepID=A0ABQ8UDY1_9EUKA|nr:putative MAD; mothers against decapentaplegic interacting protein [Paratrimastix pyriformis]
MDVRYFAQYVSPNPSELERFPLGAVFAVGCAFCTIVICLVVAVISQGTSRPATAPKNPRSFSCCGCFRLKAGKEQHSRELTTAPPQPETGPPPPEQTEPALRPDPPPPPPVDSPPDPTPLIVPRSPLLSSYCPSLNSPHLSGSSSSSRSSTLPTSEETRAPTPAATTPHLSVADDDDGRTISPIPTPEMDVVLTPDVGDAVERASTPASTIFEVALATPRLLTPPPPLGTTARGYNRFTMTRSRSCGTPQQLGTAPSRLSQSCYLEMNLPVAVGHPGELHPSPSAPPPPLGEEPPPPASSAPPPLSAPPLEENPAPRVPTPPPAALVRPLGSDLNAATDPSAAPAKSLQLPSTASLMLSPSPPTDVPTPPQKQPLRISPPMLPTSPVPSSNTTLTSSLRAPPPLPGPASASPVPFVSPVAVITTPGIATTTPGIAATTTPEIATTPVMPTMPEAPSLDEPPFMGSTDTTDLGGSMLPMGQSHYHPSPVPEAVTAGVVDLSMPASPPLTSSSSPAGAGMTGAPTIIPSLVGIPTPGTVAPTRQSPVDIPTVSTTSGPVVDIPTSGTVAPTSQSPVDIPTGTHGMVDIPPSTMTVSITPGQAAGEVATLGTVDIPPPRSSPVLTPEPAPCTPALTPHQPPSTDRASLIHHSMSQPLPSPPRAPAHEPDEEGEGDGGDTPVVLPAGSPTPSPSPPALVESPSASPLVLPAPMSRSGSHPPPSPSSSPESSSPTTPAPAGLSPSPVVRIHPGFHEALEALPTPSLAGTPAYAAATATVEAQPRLVAAQFRPPRHMGETRPLEDGGLGGAAAPGITSGLRQATPLPFGDATPLSPVGLRTVAQSPAPATTCPPPATSNAAWIPDSAAPKCMHCGQPFTVFRRKHHCRQCGHVLCAGCCPEPSGSDPDSGTQLPRVCLRCSEAAQQQTAV